MGDKEEGAQEERRHTDRPGEISFWTDGSILDSARTGVCIAWCDIEWTMRKPYMGTNKKVFNGELYAMEEALEKTLQDGRPG